MRTLFLLFIALNSFGCPRIKAILIDACGTIEEKNEWMVLTTDIPISINNLVIDYDVNNNFGGIANSDIGVGCSWMTPRVSSMNAIKINTLDNNRLLPISPGGTIPANSTILVLTSDSLTFQYDFSNLTYYGNVYVIQSSCKRNTGAFTNLGNGANYRLTKIRYTSCRDSVWHYIGNSAINGQYGVRDRDTMKISFNNIISSLCDDYIILPIELSYFKVDCDFIYFTTESESNVKFFNIEVSEDAINWIALDNILPKNNFNISTNYIIPNLNLGSYFRLKETDLDGEVFYSDIYHKKCNDNILDFELFNLLGQKVNFPLQKGIYIKKYINKIEKIFVY
ncbi:MAG: hypothetical protein K1X33_08680 [Methanobacteriaceae archaeon]|nr:hypothetical protein [Methanobacteriaceae archaeon]